MIGVARYLSEVKKRIAHGRQFGPATIETISYILPLKAQRPSAKGRRGGQVVHCEGVNYAKF